MRNAFVEDLTQYVERARQKCRHRDVRNNERATEWSLVAPVFTILGYDVSDPYEWAPQYKKSLNRRSVDFALLGKNRQPIILVEVKAARKRNLLKRYRRQLTGYFNRTKVQLGILTSGVQWLFFTDSCNPKLMDLEPFETWDVRKEPPPVELLGILKKDVYDPKLVHEFVRGQLDEDSSEALMLPPAVALRGAPDLHNCDHCQKEFIVERWSDFGRPLPMVKSRFCSNVCRGRDGKTRTQP